MHPCYHEAYETLTLLLNQLSQRWQALLLLMPSLPLQRLRQRHKTIHKGTTMDEKKSKVRAAWTILQSIEYANQEKYGKAQTNSYKFLL